MSQAASVRGMTRREKLLLQWQTVVMDKRLSDHERFIRRTILHLVLEHAKHKYEERLHHRHCMRHHQRR